MFAESDCLSEGWAVACGLLLAAPRRELTGMVIRVRSPLPEDRAIRAAADELARLEGAQPIDEVRNTIFPAAMAARLPEPAELVGVYMADYAIRSTLAGGWGTYFGRICITPEADGAIPQLLPLVDRLRTARAGPARRSVYEVNVYSPARDRNVLRGAPCMAHLSFALGGDAERPDRLDCIASYRNQDLLRKGYGNYLGIAELQRYLADATGFRAGQLTIVATHAYLDGSGAARRRLQDIGGDLRGRPRVLK